MKLLHSLMIAAGLATALLANPAPAGDSIPSGAIQVFCYPQQTICSSLVLRPEDRFDPFVQGLLAQGQLKAQPRDWRVFYFYAPGLDEAALTEMQIRFLDELIRRAEPEASDAQED